VHHEPEDIEVLTRQARQNSFVQDYGVDTAMVLSMFKDGNVLQTMLEHMYLEQMSLLRECDILHEGVGIQAQARLLWTLLHLPEEIRDMNT